MQANLRAAATGLLHWHTTSTTDGAAVETTHATFLDALATGRRAAVEARPGQGRIRWHVEDPRGRGPVTYYVYGANGALVAEIAVSGPCIGLHEATGHAA